MSLKSVILLVVVCLSFLATQSSGAVLTVTTPTDTNDGACDAHCSLREAISAARVVEPGGGALDTITFARDLRGATIQLNNTLVISKRVIIDAPNQRRITLRGDNTFRILEIRAIVFIDGLIIRDGRAADGEGGGAYVSGLLYLTNGAVIHNTALRGGGIYLGNQARLFMADSTIADNTATGDATAAGIDMFRATINIWNSTISGNQATSTIDSVGGIRALESESYLTNSTVAYNSSNGTTNLSVGGMIALGPNSRRMSNTIVAKNTGGSRPDIYASLSPQNSLFGIADGTGGIVNGVFGNIVGSAAEPVDPRLGALGDNGGGLPTHALLPLSPAVNTGSSALANDRLGVPLTIDQRGFGRIFDSSVDIGAYEFNAPPIAVNSLITGQVVEAGGRAVSRALITLRGAQGEIKTVLTSPFGFYRVEGIPAGSYTIEAKHKSHNFAPQTVTVEESTEYVDFVSAVENSLK